MPRFEITGPDGGRYEVNAPDGASEQDVMSYVQKNMAGQSTPAPQSTPNSEAVAPQAPKPPAVNTWADVAKSAGAGVMRGVAGLAGLPGDIEKLTDAGLSYVMPETMARSKAARAQYGRESAFASSQDTTRNIEKAVGPLYKPQTTAGKYADTIGSFVPAIAAGGGGVMQKGLMALGSGGGSEFAGQMTEGTAAEPWARVGGALVGGMLPSVIARGYVPVNTDPLRAKHVDTLRKEGVTSLSAGEVTGSNPLRYLESHSNDLPFSGGRMTKLNKESAEQFTAAAMKRAGSSARQATTEAIDDMYNALGSKFDSLIQRTGGIPIRSQVLNKAVQAADDYYTVTSAANRIPLVNKIKDDLLKIATPGHPTPGWMPAEQYQTWRSQIGTVARGTSDPTTRSALYKLQDALDDAVGSSFKDQSLRDAWAQTRREYANAKVIERAADPASGAITPARLKQAAQTLHKSRMKRGKSDFSDLAYAGSEVMKTLPNSGTPARQAAERVFSAPNMMASAAAGTGGAAIGGPVGALAGAALGVAGPGLGARAFLSRPVQNWLGAAGRTRPGVPVESARLAIPSVAGAANSLPPDEEVKRRLEYIRRRELAQALMRN